MNQPYLQVEHLFCGYGKSMVAQDVSFFCDIGSCLAILGPNGCGKTTVLRAVAGLLPYSGRILLNGRDVRTLSRRQLSGQVALLSQVNTQISFSYTVYETVAMGRYLQRRQKKSGGFLWLPTPGEKKEEERSVMEALQSVGLAALRDRDITRLSGGQLQRVFLARAFVQNPVALLLDEPANHLDLRHQLDLMELIRTWLSEGNRLAMGVFHDLDMSLAVADQTVFLRDGQVLSFGSTKSVFCSGALEEGFQVDVRKHMTDSLRRWETLQ